LSKPLFGKHSGQNSLAIGSHPGRQPYPSHPAHTSLHETRASWLRSAILASACVIATGVLNVLVAERTPSGTTITRRVATACYAEGRSWRHAAPRRPVRAARGRRVSGTPCSATPCRGAVACSTSTQAAVRPGEWRAVEFCCAAMLGSV
jgi:hypothetical protein